MSKKMVGLLLGKSVIHKVIVATALALAISTPAAAATDITFTGDGLVGNVNGAPLPMQPLTGTFSYDYNSATKVISLTAFSLSIGTASFGLADVGLFYPYFTGPSDLLIGAKVNGTNFVKEGTNDFALLLYGFDPVTGTVLGNTAVGGTTQFQVTLSSVTNQFFNANGTVIVNRAAAAVPEPATWMLMMLGMAGIGFSLRRKSNTKLRVSYI